MGRIRKIQQVVFSREEEAGNPLFLGGDDKREARATPKTKTDTEVRRSERNILYGNSEVVEGGDYECNNQ